VPFGEYVPLESWLRGAIAFFDLPMSQFQAGPPGAPHILAGQNTVATFICYEIVYPDFVAAGARESSYLVTVSNDSWFGHSIGPLQHLEMARFRALETGRPLLRGTNNGISAIIDHRGEVQVSSTQFLEEVIRGEIQPRTGTTPFMRLGSAPIVALCLMVIVAAGIQRRRN
jgi:apolipoprotein N-acyltransferase